MKRHIAQQKKIQLRHKIKNTFMFELHGSGWDLYDENEFYE